MTQRKYTSLSYIEKPVASGNFDSNRKPVTMVVLHTTDGSLAGTLAWFNNPASGVSSNYVVDTDGKIYAMLEEYNVPYTNGNYVSNQQSITIECVDNNNPTGPRTDATYNTLAKLVREICQAYNLPIDRAHIKGHREVSSTHPNCPGSLDLDRVAREASTQAAPQPQDPMATISQKELDQIRTDRDRNSNLYQAQIKITDDQAKQITDLKARINNAKQALG